MGKLSQSPTWNSHTISKKSSTPNLVKPYNKNDFQTWRYLQYIPLRENNKIWGGHWLQNHPQNPSQNPSKHVNHLVIIGRRTAWYPCSSNTTIHITNHNWEIISTPGPLSTSSSSVSQCGCRWISKVYSALCVPSGPMAPNGKYGRHPEATTPRVSRQEVLQGSSQGIHQLCQPHTRRTHPDPIQLSWYHLTHGHRGEWAEYETIMVSHRPNGGSIQTNWGRSGVFRSY